MIFIRIKRFFLIFIEKKFMELRILKWPAIAFIFICCTQPQVISEVFALPEMLKETSAVEITPKSDRIWVLQDHGNKPEVYALDASGHISHTLKIDGAANNDWEELASDAAGNLYIGDFGNNDNDRKDLAIYMVAAKDLDKESVAVSKKITFRYPDQTEFPPAKNTGHLYDAEAFIFHKNNFYIFTKDRGGNSNTRLYKIPAKEDDHVAEYIGQFPTCDGKKCRITGADISDDGQKIVLLSNNKIWLLDRFKGDDFLKASVNKVDLGSDTQLEGVCFKNNATLYFVDERDKHTGGKLYEMKI